MFLQAILSEKGSFHWNWRAGSFFILFYFFVGLCCVLFFCFCLFFSFWTRGKKSRYFSLWFLNIVELFTISLFLHLLFLPVSELFVGILIVRINDKLWSRSWRLIPSVVQNFGRWCILLQVTYLFHRKKIESYNLRLWR